MDARLKDIVSRFNTLALDVICDESLTPGETLTILRAARDCLAGHANSAKQDVYGRACDREDYEDGE